jgi:hypothetical protein
MIEAMLGQMAERRNCSSRIRIHRRAAGAHISLPKSRRPSFRRSKVCRPQDVQIGNLSRRLPPPVRHRSASRQRVPLGTAETLPGVRLPACTTDDTLRYCHGRRTSDGGSNHWSTTRLTDAAIGDAETSLMSHCPSTRFPRSVLGRVIDDRRPCVCTATQIDRIINTTCVLTRMLPLGRH